MPAPDQIGRYRVERRLGSGAFAVVWLAHDDRLEAPVAVKVMADNWAYRMDIRERFLAEARLLRKATAGGVVQVFDIGELSDDRPYFVMEYADRGTLEDRMAFGPVPVAEALPLVAQVTRGVQGLHETGVVHRDIKPSNVLLAGGGTAGRERVLVADLGLAKNLAQASGLTVVAGSVGYMAPEQAEPYDGIDGRADVYSLGAVLYHLVSGTVPGSTDRILPLAELREDLPPELTSAVTRAMEPDREARWPTAAAFAEELERLGRLFADRTERPGPPPAGASPRAVAATPSTEYHAPPHTHPRSPLTGPGAGAAAGAAAGSALGPAPGSVPGPAVGPTPGAATGPPDGTPPTGQWTEPEVAPSAESHVRSQIWSQAGSQVRSRESQIDPRSGISPTAGPAAPGRMAEDVTGAPSADLSAVPGHTAAPVEASAVPAGPDAAAASAAPGSPGSPSGLGTPVITVSAPPEPTPPSPAKRRRKRTAVGLVALVVLLACAAAVVTSMNPPSSPSTTVRVSDATNRVSVEVPAKWAEQTTGSGWSPASMGLSRKSAPGLTVAQNVKRWQDLTAQVSGVFVGTDGRQGTSGTGSGSATVEKNGANAAGDETELTEKIAAIKHRGCSYAGSRAYDSTDWKGRIRTWSSCSSPGHSLEEIGLKPKSPGQPQVYVQIRCDAECSARTAKVLRSLQIKGS